MGGRFQTYSVDFITKLHRLALGASVNFHFTHPKDSARLPLKQQTTTANCTVGNNMIDSASVYTYRHTVYTYLPNSFVHCTNTCFHCLPIKDTVMAMTKDTSNLWKPLLLFDSQLRFLLTWEWINLDLLSHYTSRQDGYIKLETSLANWAKIPIYGPVDTGGNKRFSWSLDSPKCFFSVPDQICH